MLGTAHVSARSAADSAALIRAVRPQTVRPAPPWHCAACNARAQARAQPLTARAALFRAPRRQVVVNYASGAARAEEVVAEVHAAGGEAVAIGGNIAKARRALAAPDKRRRCV